MPDREKPLPLSPAMLKPAAASLATAFQEDAFFTYAILDGNRRRKVLPWLFERILRIGLLDGQVFATPSMDGVIVWLGPESPSLSAGAVLRSRIFLLPFKLRPADFIRSTRLGNYSDRLHRRAIRGSHIYLYELGVVPQRRGRGIGRQLLQLLLELADQTGLRCYLDTYNESILPFYASNGFRVAALGRASPNSPTIWGMLRDRARDILLR